MTEKSTEVANGPADEKPPIHGEDNVAYVSSTDDVVVSFEPGQKPSDVSGQPSVPAEVDNRYGCGSFKPSCLQVFGNIKMFVVLAVLLCLTEGFAVNGIANAALVHLEKQDIGALVVVLFVSFVGNRFCKPHWVAVGSLIMALGSFLFIVPHLATSATEDTSGPPPTGVCDLTPDNSTSGGSGDPGGAEDSALGPDLSHYLGVLMVANMVHGVGFTPMFTLGTVYIDENEEHTTAAVYVGMTYAAAAIGVALGFFAGGQMTENYYVNFDKVDQDTLTFGPRAPQWVGAWWLGFIPSCIVFVLLFAPIYGFPKALPNRKNRAEDAANGIPESKDGPTSIGGDKKVTDAANGPPEAKDGDKSLGAVIKEILILFVVAVKKLVVNPLFILLSLGAAAETLIISGVSSFAFKYLAEQYSMSFDKAGNILGGLILVGAVGMLSGGVLIRLFHLEAMGMTRMLVILTIISSALGLAILAGCSEIPLAGKEVAYPGDTSVNNYTASCQGSCQCADVAFDPICGSDNRVYFSPCHAGCLDIKDPGPSATYQRCSCIAEAQNVSLTDSSATAKKGRCPQSCDNENIFLPCLFFMFFAVLLTTTPNSMAILRVVDQDIRPFALGFQWMLIRLLGTIPGPPVVGYVLDQTCLIWSTAPDGTESCAMYSKGQMSTGIFIWWMVVNLLATLFYLAAACMLGRNKKSVDLK